MNHNGGPGRLIAQMKSLNNSESGFQIVSNMKAGNLRLIVDFRPFKDFVNHTAGALGLKRSGEFYFNYTQSGFIGIVCFQNSHLEIQTNPLTGIVRFESFFSDRLLNNINVAEELYRACAGFLGSAVVEEEYAFTEVISNP